MSSRPQQVKKAAAVTLVDFVRGKAKAGCPLCKLAPEVRAQLGRSATKKGFTRDDQVEWLRTAVGAKGITLEHLAEHLNGRHDRDLDAQV